MITTQQHLGIHSMTLGSFLHCLYIINWNPIPQIVSIEPMLSIFLINCGIILSYGFKEINDHFLKTLGINMYRISLAYQYRGIISTPISYSSCALGGLLAMVGIILVYLKRGKPTVSTIIGQICLGSLFCAIAITTIVDFWWKAWSEEYSLIHPNTIGWILVLLSLGVFNLLLGALLNYILKRKNEGDSVEPDVIFALSPITFFDYAHLETDLE